MSPTTTAFSAPGTSLDTCGGKGHPECGWLGDPELFGRRRWTRGSGPVSARPAVLPAARLLTHCEVTQRDSSAPGRQWFHTGSRGSGGRLSQPGDKGVTGGWLGGPGTCWRKVKMKLNSTSPEVRPGRGEGGPFLYGTGIDTPARPQAVRRPVLEGPDIAWLTVVARRSSSAPGRDVVLLGIPTRGVFLAQAARRPSWSRSPTARSRSAPSTSRCTATTCACTRRVRWPARRSPVTASTAGWWSSSTTVLFSGRIDPCRPRRPERHQAPRACSSRSWSTAATANLPSAPTTSRKTSHVTAGTVKVQLAEEGGCLTRAARGEGRPAATTDARAGFGMPAWRVGCVPESPE